ncbi:MAG: hypothetical protein LUQ31_10085 [Methanoregula sp.]|nr:hypothetical protein [Methanoregula sp.]
MTRIPAIIKSEKTRRTCGSLILWILCAGVILAGFCAAAGAATLDLPPGSVEIHSNPAGAYACIDGNYCQYTFSDGSAYFYGLNLNQSHTIRVSKAGYPTYSGTFFADPYTGNGFIGADLAPQ